MTQVNRRLAAQGAYSIASTPERYKRISDDLAIKLDWGRK